MNEPLIVRENQAHGTVHRRFYEPRAGARLRAAPQAQPRAQVRPSLAHAASVLSVAVALLGGLVLSGG